jgi:hypothetical protein
MKRTLAVFLSVVAVLLVVTAATGGVQSLITGADIKDASIGSNDIKPGAIYSHDIRDGTIAKVDLSSALLTSLQGVTGPVGPQGASGAQGPGGPQGATGATGATGPKGDIGLTGSPGAKGDTGERGVTGPKGDTGPTGPAGAKGDKGEKGSPGIRDLEADGPYPGSSLIPLHGDQGGQSTTMWTHGSPTALQSSWVMCAPGKVALGGGFGQNDDNSDQLFIVTSSPINVNAAGVLYPPSSTPTDAEGSLLAPNGWLVQGYNKSDRDLIVRPWVICAKVN